MKWVLVTGGAKRLGRDICHTLAKEGYAIAVHYRKSSKDADAVVDLCRSEGVKAEKIQGDFSSPKQTVEFIARYLEKFPATYGLVNNVGNFFVEKLTETTEELWSSLFQLNVHTPFSLSMALIPSLKKVEGFLFNIGVSGLDRNRAYSYSSAYMIAKETLLSQTRSFALELAPFSVAVNMISPGVLDNSVDLSPKLLKTIPMHRPGKTSEICSVIAFLSKAENRYITGQNIEVAGGCRL